MSGSARGCAVPAGACPHSATAWGTGPRIAITSSSDGRTPNIHREYTKTPVRVPSHRRPRLVVRSLEPEALELEPHTEPYLSLARARVARARTHAERLPEGGAVHISRAARAGSRARNAPVRMVEQVEELGAELGPLASAANREGPERREVHVPAPGPRNSLRPVLPNVTPCGWLNTDVSK